MLRLLVRQNFLYLLFPILVAGWYGKAFAQIKAPFLLRYQSSLKGSVTLIGNNVLSLSPTGNYNGTLGNHNISSVFVDIDQDTGTFNSSNATLVLPTGLVCPTTGKALLYWSAADMEDPGGEPDWDFNQVLLRIPGDTAYRLISADQVIYQGRLEHFYNDPYVCVKDITQLVGENPEGTYQVANVKAKKGTLFSHGGGNTGTSGGWILVFVYESPSLPQKNIALFDGYVHVANEMSPNPLPFTFTGFQTVPSGNVNVDFLMGSLEGDWDLTGDYCEIQRTNGTWLTMSSALRQTDNFFHSIIGVDGAQFLNRVPASQNTLGFDADKFPIPNAGNAVIGNNQTSATIRMGTSQEIYGLFLAGLSVDVWYPSLLAMFTIPAMPGGSGGVLNAGDTASFLISVQNTGNDDATGVTLQSQLPPALDFLGVEPPLSPGVSWQYDTLTQILQFSVADSLATAGNPPFQIRYRTRVSSDCNLADTSFLHPVCQISLGYHGAINPALFTATGSTAVNSCGIGNQAPVTFSIIPPLFPPVARDDTASTPEDTPVTIPILANDYDCNNNLNINSIWVTTPPLHGTFQTEFNTGWIIYTPNLNYYGPDTLVYRVCDEDGQCDTARVAISVPPVNDPPSVQNEEYVACINGKIEGNLLANDADTVENTALTVMLPPLSGPKHGTLQLGVSGIFEYTPFPGFNGSDTIIVSVCDSGFPMPPMCLNDTVMLRIMLPVSANAGPDLVVCGDTAIVLPGNDPSPGIGTWSQILGPSPASLLPLSDSSVLACGLIPGDYRFRYTIAAGECLSDDTLNLRISPPLSQAEAGPDQFLCLENPDTTGTLLAGNTPASGTGHWSQAAGPTLAFLLSPGEPGTRVSALAEGEYRFVWTVTNGICTPVSDTVAIRVSRRAIVKAGRDLTLCPGQSAAITSSSATGYLSIHWSTTGSGTFNDPTLLHPLYFPSTSDVEAGAVRLILTVSSPFACPEATDTMTLTLHHAPTAYAGQDGETCSGQPFPLEGASLTDASQYTWDHNGLGTLSGSNTLSPVYYPAAGESGIVTITLTATGIAPCDAMTVSSQVRLTIHAGLVADAGADPEITAGTSATLNGTAAGGSGSYTFLWEPEALFLVNQGEEVSTVALTHDTLVILTATDLVTGCRGTDTLRIRVTDIPQHPQEECLRFYNFLTPNGDGENDTWIIDCIENFPLNRVIILDRWGDRIRMFDRYDNKAVAWDGSNERKEPVPDGTYYYVVTIRGGGTHTGWIYLKGGRQ